MWIITYKNIPISIYKLYCLEKGTDYNLREDSTNYITGRTKANTKASYLRFSTNPTWNKRLPSIEIKEFILGSNRFPRSYWRL